MGASSEFALFLGILKFRSSSLAEIRKCQCFCEVMSESFLRFLWGHLLRLRKGLTWDVLAVVGGLHIKCMVFKSTKIYIF